MRFRKIIVFLRKQNKIYGTIQIRFFQKGAQQSDLVSCSSTGIKLVDEYYIYPPDEYYNSYYLKCKLSSDNDPIIDSVHIVYWNDSTIIIERKAKHDNWIINAFDNNLKCCNNDTVVGPVSTSYIKVFMENKKFKKLVFE